MAVHETNVRRQIAIATNHFCRPKCVWLLYKDTETFATCSYVVDDAHAVRLHINRQRIEKPCQIFIRFIYVVLFSCVVWQKS